MATTMPLPGFFFFSSLFAQLRQIQARTICKVVDTKLSNTQRKIKGKLREDSGRYLNRVSRYTMVASMQEIRRAILSPVIAGRMVAAEEMTARRVMGMIVVEI